MKFACWTRKTALSIALGLATVSLQACGDGSSRVSGQDGVPTATATEGTIVPTPTPEAPPIIVRENQSLNAVINNAPRNSTIIVVSGTYSAVSLTGDDRGPLRIIADEEGTLVQDAIKGDVTILANNNGPAINLNGQSDITFEGFQLRGGRDSTVSIYNSPGTDIRHCRITGSANDGVLVEFTDDIILFNNAIWGHAGSGVQILDTNFVEVYNNTFYGNGRSGITIGSSLQPASNIILRNNIFRANSSAGITVDAASIGIDSNYNLINDGLRGLLAGSRDIVGNRAEHNPLFLNPDAGDFHMARGLATSVSPAVDTGDPLTPLDFLSELRVRTTLESRIRDTGTVDMGYHYPFSIVATPTPNPTLTPTNTRSSDPVGPSPVRTPTPTFTPTPTTTPEG